MLLLITFIILILDIDLLSVWPTLSFICIIITVNDCYFLQFSQQSERAVCGKHTSINKKNSGTVSRWSDRNFAEKLWRKFKDRESEQDACIWDAETIADTTSTDLFGSSTTVWYLVGSADGPPPTSKYASEADCALSRSCASASDSSRLVELDASDRRCGRNISLPANTKHTNKCTKWHSVQNNTRDRHSTELNPRTPTVWPCVL